LGAHLLQPLAESLLAMKPGTITHTVAVILSSLSALFSTSAAAQSPGPKVKLSKKQQNPLNDDVLLRVDPIGYTPPDVRKKDDAGGGRYPWKTNIVTTVFWIGEQPSANNPVPNRSSSWDKQWARNYGGYDDPSRANRSNYIPANFVPKQNPFYCALPYNDKAREGHRPEASRVVPWFKEAYRGPGLSVCKDRWVAIRKGNRVVYAQWEDAGPFRTDHWEYVFGNERPKPNLNRGAGLDVSPAVRDYLGLQDTDVTDWKFVDFEEVPHGPWARYGDNNTFVINARKGEEQVASAKKKSAVIFR
jgi:hypothetical protein